MDIDDLTSEQVHMCDVIWNIKDQYEFRKVSRTWSDRKVKMAQTLIQIMVQEELEQEIKAMGESYPLAQEMIRACR